MVVIKRDGREAEFDKGKIANAIPVCITAISGATVRFLLRKSRTMLKLS